MSKESFSTVDITLDTVVGGGQTLGTMDSGQKLFAWGGLPGETVKVQLTKKKSHFVEGVVTEVITPSDERTMPRDPDSYLSTSPWQIMQFAAENHYKAALIEEAFELHDMVLPAPITVYSDGVEYGYRNKIEYSWYGDSDAISGVDTLDVAFFRRGSKGKIVVDGTSLARPEINAAARRIRDVLRARHTSARSLKTLLIRCNRAGDVAAQLYVKDESFGPFNDAEVAAANLQGFELIYSNPLSPASVITKRLQSSGQTYLHDTILNVPFTYAVEGFFQINLPVYEQALRDMSEWVNTAPARVTRDGVTPTSSRITKGSERDDGVARAAGPADSDLRASSNGTGDDGSGGQTVDLYSGVGTIGLTIGGDHVTLVESNEHAVREMRRNIAALGRTESATPVLATSETALDYITGDATIIVDPPRAGLHADVITRLLDVTPGRIIYLSCNPVTQARDVARLCADDTYGIRHHQGYNFFPHTPHIEHLVILDKK